MEQLLMQRGKDQIDIRQILYQTDLDESITTVQAVNECVTNKYRNRCKQ